MQFSIIYSADVPEDIDIDDFAPPNVDELWDETEDDSCYEYGYLEGRWENGAPLFVDARQCTFFELLRGPHHSLVLFASTTQGDAWTVVIGAAESAVMSHGHWIDVFIVTDRVPQRPPSSAVTVITDPEQSLRQRYGVTAAALYLIRPDGYVAYRSSRLDSLGDYLDRVL
jgi:hypothetical protein